MDEMENTKEEKSIEEVTLNDIDLEDNKTREKYEIETNRVILNDFILDHKQIIKKALFPFCTFKHNDQEVGAFGLFLVKETEDLDRATGQKIGIKQRKVPVLLCSDYNIKEIRSTFKEVYRIEFETPDADNYPLRISYDAIREFVERKYKKVDGYKLFNSIKAQYEKYLYFISEGWYLVRALWDMGTYFFLLFKYYPIYELRGLMGTAKSKIMTISRLISFNASEELTNPTESTLFRDTHNNRPTLYIDEAEKLFITYKGKVEPDSRAEVINSGYKYTGKVPRQESIGRKFKTIYYSTYCPKVVASINGLFGATEDRAIVHTTTKAPLQDKRSEIEPDENLPYWQYMRDDLYIYALQNWKQIKDLYDNFKEDVGLKSRDYWIWKPILILAKYINEDLYKKTLIFAKQQAEIKKIDIISEGSTEYNILKAIWELLLDQKIYAGKILVSDISNKLPDEFRPSNKTIVRHIDSFGFKDFKKKSNIGIGYELTKNCFIGVINPFLSSLASLPSLIEEANTKTSDGRVTEVTEIKIKSDGNDESDESDGVNAHNLEKKEKKIFSDLEKILKNDSKPIEDLIKEKFTENQLNDWKKQGLIFENPKGFIRLL